LIVIDSDCRNLAVVNHDEIMMNRGEKRIISLREQRLRPLWKIMPNSHNQALVRLSRQRFAAQANV
jgi:hypothetical protein